MSRVEKEVKRLQAVGSSHINSGDWDSWRYWLDDFIAAVTNWRDGYVSPGFETIKKDFDGWSNKELTRLIVGLRRLEICFELDMQKGEIDSLSQEIEKIHKSIEGTERLLCLAKESIAEICVPAVELENKKTGSE